MRLLKVGIIGLLLCLYLFRYIVDMGNIFDINKFNDNKFFLMY